MDEQREPEKERSALGKAYDAVAREVKEVSNDAIQDTKDIRDKYVGPFLKHGKNRFIAAGAGAKTGFLIGIRAGPKGVIIGTAGGAIAGFLAGPAAVTKLEKILGVKTPEVANDNKPPTEEPAPAEDHNKPEGPPPPSPG